MEIDELKQLSFYELSLQCGISRQVVSRTLRGITDPQLSTLKRMAEGWDMPIQAIVDLIDKGVFKDV